MAQSSQRVRKELYSPPRRGRGGQSFRQIYRGLLQDAAEFGSTGLFERYIVSRAGLHGLVASTDTGRPALYFNSTSGRTRCRPENFTESAVHFVSIAYRQSISCPSMFTFERAT